MPVFFLVPAHPPFPSHSVVPVFKDGLRWGSEVEREARGLRRVSFPGI